jgi:SAM-dependent methyltransferase
MSAALPSREALQRQARWLAPARAQLLRRVHIARRRRVMDLGAGYGVVVPELVRRAGGYVAALDRAREALHRGKDLLAGAGPVTGDAAHLPFQDGAFDLVLSQVTLLWSGTPEAAVAEIRRVLAPNGALVALEPDYGGLMEYPPAVESRDLWLKALDRAGADPYIGRKLPGLLAQQGFEVRVSLFDTLVPPAATRFEFLRGLPLTPPERDRLASIERFAATPTEPWRQVAHLPFFLIRAVRSD